MVKGIDRSMWFLTIAMFIGGLAYVLMEVYVWADKVGEEAESVIEQVSPYDGSIYGDSPSTTEEFYRQMMGQ